uniref:Matrix metallopeptidase 28 n=1 Tax=Equus caballus TaxID=9796 RepID=A0A9L0RPH6_HORSE
RRWLERELVRRAAGRQRAPGEAVPPAEEAPGPLRVPVAEPGGCGPSVWLPPLLLLFLPLLLVPQAGGSAGRRCLGWTTSGPLPGKCHGGAAQRAEPGHRRAPGTFPLRVGAAQSWRTRRVPGTADRSWASPRAAAPHAPAPRGRGGGEMVARVRLLLRALQLLLWGSLDARLAERGGQERHREAEAFLEKYGYLDEQASRAPTSTQFSSAIREFQWVSQLPVSGVLDPATLRQMMRPRCGVADTDSQVAWTERVSARFAGHRGKMRRKKRFAKQENPIKLT